LKWNAAKDVSAKTASKDVLAKIASKLLLSIRTASTM
jgi:hypothetical protein